MLEKKEGELRSDEVKLEKGYDSTIRMLKSVQAHMGEAIANNDMATKKLKTTLKHQEQQSKVRVDIGKIQKIVFNKLFRTAKKQKTVIGDFFSSR